jgi:hypothetical protein
MSTKYLLRKIGGFIFAALLVPGLMLFSSSTAEAQRRVIIVRPVRIYRPFRPFGWYGWRRPYGYPYGWNSYYSQYVFNNPETAEQQGFHDGRKTGAEDGRKGKSYDPERSHYFHDAGFGNFAEAYRDGFLHGYRAGYGPA